MDIYHYDQETGVFLEVGQAEPDPMENGDPSNPQHWLIPAHATHVTPPKIGDKQEAVWGGQQWKVRDIPTPPSPPGPTLSERKAEMVALIKAEAERRILARYPEWKQRNMMARLVALANKGRENWNDSDRQEAETAQSAWGWINGVRRHSDTLEDQVNAMNAKALDGFEPRDDQHWGAES